MNMPFRIPFEKHNILKFLVDHYERRGWNVYSAFLSNLFDVGVQLIGEDAHHAVGELAETD